MGWVVRRGYLNDMNYEYDMVWVTYDKNIYLGYGFKWGFLRNESYVREVAYTCLCH